MTKEMPRRCVGIKASSFEPTDEQIRQACMEFMNETMIVSEFTKPIREYNAHYFAKNFKPILAKLKLIMRKCPLSEITGTEEAKGYTDDNKAVHNVSGQDEYPQESSALIIGNVRSRYHQLRPDTDLDWRSFYMGWIEGRTQMHKSLTDRAISSQIKIKSGGSYVRIANK